MGRECRTCPMRQWHETPNYRGKPCSDSISLQGLVEVDSLHEEVILSLRGNALKNTFGYERDNKSRTGPVSRLFARYKRRNDGEEAFGNVALELVTRKQNNPDGADYFIPVLGQKTTLPLTAEEEEAVEEFSG